jgi:ribosomal-protein-alanine N-acetyltransferase
LLEVRAGGPADLDAIAAIQAAAPEASHWTVGDYLAYDLYVAEDSGSVVGFLAARRLGGGEGEILNLAVRVDQRRRGIARRLLETWIRDGPGTIYLEVRESNMAALNLYKSLSFQELGIRKNYYEHPPEGAIVLKFRSC